jgi:hypothetical protein
LEIGGFRQVERLNGGWGLNKYKQVDKNTWIIGSLILHSSSGRSDTSSWYDSTDNIGGAFQKVYRVETPWKLVVSDKLKD